VLGTVADVVIRVSRMFAGRPGIHAPAAPGTPPGVPPGMAAE